MRPLAEWDETDLQQLITDQVHENLHLDYKQSDSLAKTSSCQTELAKDVSAFANSAGGRVIYGIVEHNNLPVSIDGGADAGVISREWIENTINSKIQPRIPGILIKPIPLVAGGIAYVIDIPQATTFAPHQAGHRYYRRYNFQSVPMEDYEVKDALRRATVGDPFMRFSWALDQGVEETAAHARLSIHAGNHSSEPIMYARVQVMIDDELVPAAFAPPEWEIQRNVVARMAGQIDRVVVLFSRNITPNNHMPLFKEQEWLMFEMTVPVPPAFPYHLGYDIAGPGFARALGGRYLINGFEVGAQVVGSEQLFYAGLPQQPG